MQLLPIKNNDQFFNGLLEEYLREINNFEPILTDENGLRGPHWLEYYYNATNHFGYYFQNEGNICGFVLVCNHSFLAEDERLFLSEFYILPKYRHQKLGKQAAIQLFKLYEGKWELSVHPLNLPSIRFWESVLNNIVPDTWRVYKGISGVFDHSLADIYQFENDN